MKKIDRYILKKLLVTFFFCMMLFTVIAVAIDTSEKTDDFVKEGLSTGQIITEYYFGFVPFIWGLLFPLFVFIAVIYFTSRMATRSEIISILASGTSFNRFLRPYFVGGVFLAAVLWFANRYLIPKANEIKSKFEITHLKKGTGYGNTDKFFLRADSNTYFGIRYYDTAAKRATGFFLNKVDNNKMVYNVRAETIAWDTARKSWKLTNVVTRTIDSMKEVTTNAEWIYMESLNVKPADLRRDEFMKDKLTTPQLAAYIKAEQQRGTEGLSTLQVEQYRRSATPFTVLLLAIIGAVIASRKIRGGSGLHLAIGIAIAAIFIVSDRFSTVFAVKSNLPPLLAAWLPNIVFCFVALYFYRKAPK